MCTYIYPASRIRKCLPALASGPRAMCIRRESAAAGWFSTVYAPGLRTPGRYGRTGRHLQAVVHIRRTVQA